MARRICLPTLLLLTLALPCIAAGPSDFQFRKEVKRAAAVEEMLGIDLDAEIYKATRDGYPDLRVFDGRNAEMPFLLQEVAEERIKTVRRDCPGRVVSLKENDDDNSIEIVGFKTTEDADEKQTIIEVQTNREPLTSLTIASGSRNFSRRAVVQAPRTKGVRTHWVEIGTATVSKVDFAGFNRERLKITFPEHRKKTFRIVIDNEDNPPLDITGVQARGNIRRIVFLAGPEPAADVYYGSTEAKLPRYEAATVLGPLLAKTEPAAATLGPQEPNPDFGPPSGLAVRRLLGSRYFLIAAICLMVIVLAWGLYRAGRQIDGVVE